MLKWKTIPASLREHLTDEQCREIELEENENRKSLTERERTRTYESSKRLVENARKAEEVIGAAPKTSNPKGGRPTKGRAPQEEVARALGTSPRAIDRAERHFEMAEWYPWMQGNRWRPRIYGASSSTITVNVAIGEATNRAIFSALLDAAWRGFRKNSGGAGEVECPACGSRLSYMVTGRTGKIWGCCQRFGCEVRWQDDFIGRVRAKLFA
jgi:hypothetical protein